MTRKDFSLERIKNRISKRKRSRTRFLPIKYNPDIHCGVLNSDGRPCTRVVTCHVHKIFQKEGVPGRHNTVRNLIRRYKLRSASLNASKLKGNSYDPDRHCGVKNLEGYPCMKVITCNTHLMPEKRVVQGRSKSVDELLKQYKTSLVNSIPKASLRKSSQLKEWKKKLNVRLYYNPDKNCGVKDSGGLPCLRVVTCDIHKIGQKREVPGRSKEIEELIKCHKMELQRKARTLTLPANAGLVLYSPIKMILPKKNDSDVSTSSQFSSEQKQVYYNAKRFVVIKHLGRSKSADLETKRFFSSSSQVSKRGEGNSHNMQMVQHRSLVQGSKPVSFILKQRLYAKKEKNLKIPMNNDFLVESAKVPKTPVENLTNLQDPPLPLINQEANKLELQLPVIEQETDLDELPLPVSFQEQNLQELAFLITSEEESLPELPLPVIDSDLNFEELPFEVTDQETNQCLEDIFPVYPITDAEYPITDAESTEHDPELTEHSSVSNSCLEDFVDFRESYEFDTDMFCSSIPAEGAIPESLQSIPMPIEATDVVESYSNFVTFLPIQSADIDSTTDFSGIPTISYQAPIGATKFVKPFIDSVQLSLKIEPSFEDCESAVNLTEPIESYSIPSEDIEVLNSVP